MTCMRCGSGWCRSHVRSWGRFGTDHGVGETLADAAFNRGFVRAPQQPYTCENCRTQDGRKHQREIVQRYAHWKDRNPILNALTWAGQGYVTTGALDIELEAAVAWWLNWKNKPTASPSVLFVTRRRKVVRKAVQGWAFPQTIGYTDYDSDRGDRVVWNATMVITTEGQTQELISPHSAINVRRIMLQMSRMLYAHKGLQWKGQDPGYD